MLRKFHKTTSECWQRTADTQKDSPLSSKGGRDEDPSQEGSLKKERSFQIPGNTLTGESVVSLGTSKGNITGRKNE